MLLTCISESFGGDASHVTIFGESAGAGSMSNHLVAHNSWGLYHAVAMESGSFPEWASVSMSCAQSNYDFLLKHTGCDTPQCLKRVPAKLIRDIAGGNYNVRIRLTLLFLELILYYSVLFALK